MGWFRRALFAKISLILLLLLLGLAAVQLWWSMRMSTRFAHEADQVLSWSLAKDLSGDFAPMMADSLDTAAIEHRIHELMVMNPRVEIYILDATGHTLAYFHEHGPVIRMDVDTVPIRAFLSADAHAPIYGDDPLSIDGRKTFSAAPATVGGEPGYVYIILGGELYDSASAMVRTSYIWRWMSVGTLTTLLGTGVLGGLLLFFVTRRLTALTDTVKRFHQGDLTERAAEDGDDEIGRLGLTFNRMADKLVASMEDVQETDRLRRELIANVSHDLRGPLASIQGYLETIDMKRDSLAPVDRQRYMGVIGGNVSVLNRLVSELFELSKLDARQSEPEREYFSVAELAQDVALKFAPTAAERDVELATDMDERLPAAFADIALVERAISNLIENAIRATPPGGRVSLGLTRAGGGVRVEVSDTGIGIPEADLPYVFDRFFRVDKSRSRRSGGAGLGLAIANRIVELHGGSIEVESTEGLGTSFAFELAAGAPA